MAERLVRNGLGALALLAAVPAQAQLASCALPDRLPVLRVDTARDAQQRRVIPIGSYTLALSWSPEYCSSRGQRDRFQCGGRDNRFGFILHGLWPNGVGAQWPQYCRAVQPLPPKVLRANLCATPSADLLQHEWSKHGTCMSGTPEAYFDRARGLYAAVRFPGMAKLVRGGELTRGAFSSAFLAANKRTAPDLKADAIRVRLTRDGWLEEVRLCLDRSFRYTSCPRNAGAPGAAGQRMRIRPVA
jgi:ribonuclease T2